MNVCIGIHYPLRDCDYDATTTNSLKKHKGSKHELLNTEEVGTTGKSLWHKPIAKEENLGEQQPMQDAVLPSSLFSAPSPNQSTLLSRQSTSKYPGREDKYQINSTMTNCEYNDFDIKEEMSEVVEETSMESIKDTQCSNLQEESGSVVVMLPIKDEDITEVKEEVQDPLWMAGGC